MSGTRRRRWTVATVLAVTALALVAVGSGALGGQSKATASSVATVDIANFKFHPPALHIQVGSKVTFTNDSNVTHTATDSGGFNTGDIGPGKSVIVKFSHKGTFSYSCTIHPFMHGKIIVE